MNLLSLLLWVGQFGFSVAFPTLAFLFLGIWLQNKYNLGIWILFILGTIGVLTSFSTARSCLRSLQKAVQKASGEKEPPLSFNDHC